MNAAEIRKLTAEKFMKKPELKNADFKFADVFITNFIENAAKDGELEVAINYVALAKKYAKKIIATTKFKICSKGYNIRFDNIKYEFEYMIRTLYGRYLLVNGFNVEFNHEMMKINWMVKN